MLDDGQVLRSWGENIWLVGKNYQTLAHCETQDVCISNILSANQDDYIIDCSIDSTQHIFLLPKNQLATWINQRCAVSQIEIALTELNFQTPKSEFVRKKVIVVPEDNIIVCYQNCILSVYELVKNNRVAGIKLLWSDESRYKSILALEIPELSFIRPGFFALSVRNDDTFDVEIDEWDTKEIQSKSKNSTSAIVKPYRSCVSDLNSYDYPTVFLEDGRSAVSFSSEKIIVYDLEKQEYKPYEMKTQLIGNLHRRESDGQFFIARNKEKTQELHSISAVSFPLAERRCREIPMTLNHKDIFNLDSKITQIVIDYLGMFSRNNQKPRQAEPSPKATAGENHGKLVK